MALGMLFPGSNAIHLTFEPSRETPHRPFHGRSLRSDGFQMGAQILQVPSDEPQAMFSEFCMEYSLGPVCRFSDRIFMRP